MQRTSIFAILSLQEAVSKSLAIQGKWNQNMTTVQRGLVDRLILAFTYLV